MIKERNCKGRICEFFIRAYREKEISLVRGYGRVFTVIRERWRKGSGREKERGGKLRAGLLPLPWQKGEKAGGESAAGVHTQRN